MTHTKSTKWRQLVIIIIIIYYTVHYYTAFTFSTPQSFVIYQIHCAFTRSKYKLLVHVLSENKAEGDGDGIAWLYFSVFPISISTQLFTHSASIKRNL